MSEKNRIKNTKLLIESWDKFLLERNGLAGTNRAKVVQLLKRLSGAEQPPPVPKDDEDLPGGDGPNDALPADGADDDAVTVDDADIIDSGKDLSANDVMVVLNQLRNTGGLSFEDMGNDMLNQVRDAIKKTINTLGSRGAISSRDKQQDKENIEEVGQRILKRLEVAFEKLFQPRALLNLQEVLDVIKKEEKKFLNENKKYIIKIRK